MKKLSFSLCLSSDSHSYVFFLFVSAYFYFSFFTEIYHGLHFRLICLLIYCLH